MLCYFWCVCDQIISRNINCLAPTVTKYSHVFPSNRSQEARAMTINRIYLFDTHQKSAERQRLCRLLSFATDFVKGLVHFCQSQSHDEMSVVRCFASWTHQVFKETNWPHRRRHFSPGKDYRKRVMVDNHGVFAALQSKPLWKCRKQSQTPKDCKLQLSPVHFAQDLESIEPYWTIELFVLKSTYAWKRRLHQCISAASAFGTFEPNKFLRKRLATWENTSSENTEKT